MEHAETDWFVDEEVEPQTHGFEVDVEAEPVVEPTSFLEEEVPDDATVGEAAEALCPTCGELLAWHDEYASCRPAVVPVAAAAQLPAVADEFSQEPATEVAARPALHLHRATPKISFAYELGHLVQPPPALPAQVIWRGQLKERHPATGLVHRVNVYRLNDGYWDCYREEELQAA